MKYNELKELIQQKLALDTQNSDVLEYMLLERASVLGKFKDSKLLCRTTGDSSSSRVLRKSESQTSLVVFGFDTPTQEKKLNPCENPWRKLSEQESKQKIKAAAAELQAFQADPAVRAQLRQLHQITFEILKCIPKAGYDREADFYRTFERQTAFIISNSAILETIKSSSLITASDDIKHLNVDELTILRQGVLLYTINPEVNVGLNALVNTLIMKIDSRLNEKLCLKEKVNSNSFFQSPSFDADASQASANCCTP